MLRLVKHGRTSFVCRLALILLPTVGTLSASIATAQAPQSRRAIELKDFYRIENVGSPAISPDGKTGKVRISFTVNANGTLDNFKVTKSLSTTADAKAIDLIRNGGSWVGDTDGTPHKITIKVIFK